MSPLFAYTCLFFSIYNFHFRLHNLKKNYKLRAMSKETMYAALTRVDERAITFARRNKSCVFSLLYILTLGLSPEIPTQIDWNLKIQNTTFWCIEVSSKPAPLHPWIPPAMTVSNAVSKLKAQSSNVSFATFQWKEKFELWALSFETSFENVTIGCTYLFFFRIQVFFVSIHNTRPQTLFRMRSHPWNK